MKEDGETLVVYTPDRDEWTARDKIVFFVTDHYRNYPMVLVKLVKVKSKIWCQYSSRPGVAGPLKNCFTSFQKRGSHGIRIFQRLSICIGCACLYKSGDYFFE